MHNVIFRLIFVRELYSLDPNSVFNFIIRIYLFCANISDLLSTDCPTYIKILNLNNLQKIRTKNRPKFRQPAQKFRTYLANSPICAYLGNLLSSDCPMSYLHTSKY